jgi:cation diffusion facilitator family transporter
MANQPSDPRHDERVRLRAALVSLAVGCFLLAVKYVAYRLTGSTAILSDALESVVNVVAAAFAVGGIVFSGRPADRNHPYGHGKIEFFSAVFEGGLISFAAVLIIYQAGLGLLLGTEIKAINTGLLITLAAGVVNAALGWFLIRTGRRYQSLTLVADGQHVLTDFWTSVGVAVGLGLVWVTGYNFFDPLVAAAVGVNLGWMGFRLVRHAAGGLLDEEDTELVGRLVAAINSNVTAGIIRVHYLRAIRAGRFTHVDAHVVVPEFWSVERAHAATDDFERRVIQSLPFEGEIAFHTDPCRQAYCAGCDVDPCPIRLAPFLSRLPITVTEAVQPDFQAAGNA